MGNLLLNIISSAAVSGALSGALIWLSRNWISERLKNSIKHEYDQKLEAHKAKLKIENDVALLELNTKIEREVSLYVAAHASFAEGQKAAMERKLTAIDKLWESTVALDKSLLPITAFITVITAEEYKTINSNLFFQDLTRELSKDKIAGIAGGVDGMLEKVRPYVGEYLWTLFTVYQTIMLRILYLLCLGKEDASKLEWFKDTYIRQLMEVALPEKEMSEFDQIRLGHVSWLQNSLHAKMIAEMNKVISGEKLSTESLKESQRINQIISEITSHH